MSQDSNTNLLELAAEHREYWTGTIMEKLINHSIEIGDYEELQELLKDSASRMFQREYSPNEVY